jgi:uncharacterized protein (DUF4415 family)
MKTKLVPPSAKEDAAIARAIASDPEAAPDLSGPIAGIVRRLGRPPKADPKVSVTLRLDRDVIDRFKATGQGWQTRINAVLKKSKVG